MRTHLLLAFSAAVLLAGCSSQNVLTAAGQQVKFTDTKPGNECQFLGDITGTQSNWLSGNGGEGNALRSAANDLRNKAAEMGGNVIYGATSPSDTLLSAFVPTDSKMSGQVYKCR